MPKSGKREGRRDHQVLGGIVLRHELYESGIQLGHIGYGIRSTAGQHGLATWRWAGYSMKRGGLA